MIRTQNDYVRNNDFLLHKLPNDYFNKNNMNEMYGSEEEQSEAKND